MLINNIDKLRFPIAFGISYRVWPFDMHYFVIMPVLNILIDKQISNSEKQP